MGNNLRQRPEIKRRRGAAPGGKAVNLNAMRLYICLAVLAVAIAAKVLFAAPSQKLRDGIFAVVSGDVDYRSAITAIGEGIGGEKPLSQAFSEAYDYAFKIVPDSDKAAMSQRK